MQMLGEEGKGAPPRGQVWGGGPAGAAVSLQQLLARAPEDGRAAGPQEQVAGGEPSGPERAT